MSRDSARHAARRSTGRRIFRGAARPDRGKTQLCIDYFDRPLRAQVFPAHPGDEVSDALRGYDPGTIMTAAFNGINYWCEQAFLVQKLTTRQVASEGDAAAQGYKNKLLEVHSAYKRAKAKAEALWQQMQQLELDKKELQSKYEQKSGEKRRIEASFRELQSRAVAGAGAPAPTHALPRAHSHAVAMPPPSRHAYQQMASPPMHLGSPPVDRRPGTLQSRPSMANFGGGNRPLLSGFPAAAPAAGPSRAQTRPISPYSGDQMSPPRDWRRAGEREDDEREWRRGGGAGTDRGGNRGGAPRASRGGYRPPHSPTRSHRTFSIGN